MIKEEIIYNLVIKNTLVQFKIFNTRIQSIGKSLQVKIECHSIGAVAYLVAGTQYEKYKGFLSGKNKKNNFEIMSPTNPSLVNEQGTVWSTMHKHAWYLCKQLQHLYFE